MALATFTYSRFLDAALAPAYDVVLGAHVDIDGLIIHVDTNDVIAVPTIGFLCTQMCPAAKKKRIWLVARVLPSGANAPCCRTSLHGEGFAVVGENGSCTYVLA